MEVTETTSIAFNMEDVEDVDDVGTEFGCRGGGNSDGCGAKGGCLALEIGSISYTTGKSARSGRSGNSRRSSSRGIYIYVTRGCCG